MKKNEKKWEEERKELKEKIKKLEVDVQRACERLDSIREWRDVVELLGVLPEYRVRRLSAYFEPSADDLRKHGYVLKCGLPKRDAELWVKAPKVEEEESDEDEDDQDEDDEDADE